MLEQFCIRELHSIVWGILVQKYNNKERHVVASSFWRILRTTASLYEDK